MYAEKYPRKSGDYIKQNYFTKKEGETQPLRINGFVKLIPNETIHNYHIFLY